MVSRVLATHAGRTLSFWPRRGGWKAGLTADRRQIIICLMTPASLALLASSTLIFVGAASSAKAWALSADNAIWLVLTLLLYTMGNLIMLRLIRDVGMGAALSLSAVVQLIAVNIVALAFFGERVTAVQAAGLVLAIVAVAMITLGPARG